MEELIKVLKQIEEDDSIQGKVCDEDGKMYLPRNSDNALLDEAEGLACIHLINSTSTCLTMESRLFMSDHGYPVFAGDQDSFGWLSGCIWTKKGILVYG